MLPLHDDTLSQLFLDARTHNVWLDRPVDDATLRRAYELARMAPTAVNCQPLRVVFVRSAAAKERLRPALRPNNVDKTMQAPVTAIAAFDADFAEQMPKLFPGRDVRSQLLSLPEPARLAMGESSATLQIAYFLLAARALGLDCGPMGGFDKAAVDAAFFAGSAWRSVLLVNLGHGDRSRLSPRNPRLDFDEACRVE